MKLKYLVSVLPVDEPYSRPFRHHQAVCNHSNGGQLVTVRAKLDFTRLPFSVNTSFIHAVHEKQTNVPYRLSRLEISGSLGVWKIAFPCIGADPWALTDTCQRYSSCVAHITRDFTLMWLWETRLVCLINRMITKRSANSLITGPSLHCFHTVSQLKKKTKQVCIAPASGWPRGVHVTASATQHA